MILKLGEHEKKCIRISFQMNNNVDTLHCSKQQQSAAASSSGMQQRHAAAACSSGMQQRHAARWEG
jgi:hypothetical protein